MPTDEERKWVDDLLRTTPRRLDEPATNIGEQSPPEHTGNSAGHDLDDISPESDRADETTQGGEV